MSEPWNPPPPRPPISRAKLGFFGYQETPESKLDQAYWEGAMDMWKQWMEAIKGMPR